MKLEQIAEEASKLTEKERGTLASQLIRTLEKPHYDVSDEEVVQRVREAEENPDVMISFDELVAGLKPRGR